MCNTPNFPTSTPNSSNVDPVILYPRRTVIAKMITDGRNAIRSVSIVKLSGDFVGYVRSRTNADTVARTANDTTTAPNMISVMRTLVDSPMNVLDVEVPFLL
jgi:hypothetical protein